MDFFEHEERARRNTRRLVVLYTLAVIGVVVAVNAAAFLIFVGVESKTRGLAASALLRPELALAITAVTLAIIGGGSLYKIAALSRGGGAGVAEMLGGRPVDPNTQDPKERRLLNVVEEMALAAGLRVPTVYVLDREDGINAFAAGLERNDAVVSVTRGTLELLSRDELQGVLGHEFSHILNGDMRLNLRLMGVLNGILVIGLIGYWVLRVGPRSGGSSRRGKGGGGGAILLFGLALLVIGYVGVFFAKLIKSAVSRQREFLADASSVQFTRNPAGIEGALKKIGGLADGSRLRSPHAEQASHMFFGNGLAESLFAWMSTHPPLAERIHRIDPSFDGTFPEIERPKTTAEVERADRRKQEKAAFAGILGAGAAAVGAATLGAAAAAAATAGRPGEEHLAHARNLLATLPEELLRAAREPQVARALVLVLLLDTKPDVRSAQLALVAEDETLGLEVKHLMPDAEKIPAEARLPLVDLALPALRRLSEAQYRSWTSLLDRVIEADQRVDLFEYALHRLLRRHLAPAFEPVEPARVDIYALNQLAHECSILLSAMARAGGETEAAAAFEAGAAELPELAGRLELLTPQETGLKAIDHSLGTFSRVAPRKKRELLAALAATVASDRRITLAEGELLRAVADALDCPIPPFLPGETWSEPPQPAG